MAIAYPLEFPKTKSPAQINWRAVRVDAFSQSPFTLNAKVYKHQGQRFEIDVTMPIMARADAEEFVAFMLKLDGRSGTFLIGSAEAKRPRGAITEHLIYVQPTDRHDYGFITDAVTSVEDYGFITDAVTSVEDYGFITDAIAPLDEDGQEITNLPRTDGETQPGNVVNLKGLPFSVSNVLMAGDFIQLGAAATTKLYKVLDTVSSNATGRTNLIVWPNVIEPIADNALVIVTNTRGVFRMVSPVSEWNVGEAALFGMSFTAIQVL